MSWFHHIANRLSRWAGQLDTNEYILILSIVLVVGFVCMRGFGSRNNY